MLRVVVMLRTTDLDRLAEHLDEIVVDGLSGVDSFEVLEVLDEEAETPVLH